ncbi:MAG: tetratricopeptide repeat protein [Anaerolineae bacterium]|nr:tetratricopeptide repeat protein [Anaerolineae bacterium]
MGQRNFFLDDWAASKTDFTKALEIDPENVRALNNRGVVQFCLEEYEAAKEDYGTALQLSPQERLLIGGFAITLHALGNSEEAKKLWQGMVDTDRRYLDAKWVGEQMLWPESMIEEADKITKAL